MKLWTARIEALQGYYASEAYVVAETPEQAVERILEGVKAYIQEQIKEFGTCYAVGEDPEAPEWSIELTRFLGLVEVQATFRLEEVPSNVIINVRV